MSNSIYSVDEEERKRQAEHKLRPRPIDINQKLEILVHTLEEVEEEKNAIFFSDLTTVQYSDEPEPLKVRIKYYFFGAQIRFIVFLLLSVLFGSPSDSPL